MGYVRTLFQNAQDPFAVLSADGWLFRAAGSALNTTATGATSFATTTATFLLDVPLGVTVIPAEAILVQTGTVAGGVVDVFMEMDNADRYTSGGTAMTVLATNLTGTLPTGVAMYSTVGSAITSTDAVGVLMDQWHLGQDVSPAEGAPNKVIWTPSAGVDFIKGPGAWIINTSAGTTGPTWSFAFKFAAFPTTML